MKKKAVLLIISTIVILAGVFFINFLQKKGHFTLYVEVTEDNFDDFSHQLFEPRITVLPPPFWKTGDKIILNKNLPTAIKEGKDVGEQFSLFLPKGSLRLDKAKIFLIYVTGYAGKGRNIADVSYYIFDKLPAQIKLPAYKDTDTVNIGLDETILKTLAIRLTESEIEFSGISEKGTLNIKYGQNRYKCSPWETVALGKSEKRVSVVREIFAPLPKGEITKEDIKAEKEDYGTITFSTELKVKNFGPNKVVYEE